MARSASRNTIAAMRRVGPGASNACVRGMRAHDLSGKAGDIAATLEDRLVRGGYRFGDTLSIYGLAEEFGASRQPVSSAVLYLASVGYLEVIPQVGCRVVSPSSQEVKDYYVLFARTEALIARFASQRYEGEEAEQLLAIGEEMSQNPFESRADRAAMGDGLAVFHDHMSAMARSAILVDRISNLRRIFRFYLSQERSRAEKRIVVPVGLNKLRMRLAEAIRDRDTSAAETYMEAYILDGLVDWVWVV